MIDRLDRLDTAVLELPFSALSPTKMPSRYLVRQVSARSARMGWDDNGPTMVAISLCNVLVELIVGAVWLGIWLDYDMAANCDKELQWWYLFICLLYTSPSPRDGLLYRMPSSA